MNPRRYELTDFEWSIIQPLLPNKPRGAPRVDDRKVLKGLPVTGWHSSLITGAPIVLSRRLPARRELVTMALRSC
jgi:hypothetical protein